MDKRATEALLGQLHGALADAHLEALKRAAEKGEDVPAAILKEIREFLRDNGIEVSKASAGRMHQIVDNLPTFDDQQDHAFGG